MIYSNIPACDLRNINSVELAKNIQKIENTAAVIFPNDVGNDVKDAMASIKCENVASIIFADKSDDVIIINGVAEISNYNLNDNSIIICNGVMIVDKLSCEIKGRVYLNGLAPVNELSRDKCELSFCMVNGMVKNFNFDDYKVYQDILKLNCDTLKYLNDKTLLIAGNTIEICDDVTVEMLENKKIILFAGNTIRCSKELSGYINAKAMSGNGIEIINE